MNITPHIPQVIANAATPSTDALVKANAQREVVPPTVQTEAIVPQKTREQEARGSVSNPNNDTYEGIQNRSNDNEVIPEDEQNSEQRDPQQEQEQDSPQAKDDSSVEKEEKEQDSQERAEKQQEAQEREVITELQQRDREVRAHEQAHAAIGGSYAGAPSYDYQTGPDGKKYAVGGEVSIDVSKTNDPETTIRKMQTVRAAALAPAEPSGQDRKVAAEASQNIAEARAEMVAENSSLSVSEEVSGRIDVQIDNEETDDNNEPLATQTEATQQGTPQAGNSAQQPPSKMNLAQQFVAQDNDNKTAQVISQKYASAVQLKEHYFNAVA